jgi:predicted Fe-Mo cluster-binding NifX family protein
VKIAVVTDDQTTVSRHFGRAHYYLVFTVEDGQIVQQELRDKLGHDQFQHEHHDHDHEHEHEHSHEHGHGYGRHSQDKHNRMMANIGDCQVLLCAGMGMGAHQSLQAIGVTPILTDYKDIGAAVQAYLDGTLTDHRERLH